LGTLMAAPTMHSPRAQACCRVGSTRLDVMAQIRCCATRCSAFQARLFPFDVTFRAPDPAQAKRQPRSDCGKPQFLGPAGRIIYPCRKSDRARGRGHRRTVRTGWPNSGQVARPRSDGATSELPLAPIVRNKEYQRQHGEHDNGGDQVRVRLCDTGLCAACQDGGNH
jgi:hypothetical protein